MRVERQETVLDANIHLAFFLLKCEETILILQNASDIARQVHADLFGLPGGVVEEGETDLEAACREVWEETGVKLDATKDVIEDLGIFRIEMDNEYIFSTHLFRLKMDAKPSIILSKAHSFSLWMDLESAQTTTEFIPEIQICLQSIE